MRKCILERMFETSSETLFHANCLQLIFYINSKKNKRILTRYESRKRIKAKT